MSDIFHEVEEEVRRERFEKLWKQYGDYIIAAVALIVIAVAGFKLWQRYEDNQRLKASEDLIAAQEAAEGGNPGKAAPVLAALAANAPSDYDTIAKLTQADVLIASGQRDAAVGIYKSIASKNSGPIGDLALLRAAWAVVDTTPRADMQTMLGKLAQDGNPWRFAAREILAYADLHAGLNKQAQSEFKALGDDKDAPEQLRRRAVAMVQYLANGGATNYGTVPQPPAPPPAAPGAPGAPLQIVPPPVPAPAAPNGTPTP